MNEVVYKLRDWIDKDKINWTGISININAKNLIEANIDKINWYNFCIRKDYFSFKLICKYKNITVENLFNLSANPFAIEYLIKNPKLINWFYLCRNNNPRILEILEKNQDKIDKNQISQNTNDDILKFLLYKHPDKISKYFLSLNRNDIAVEYL